MIFKPRVVDMSFDNIRLSLKEWRQLLASRKQEVKIADYSRLRRHGLVDETTFQRERGGMPVPSGYGVISDRGKDFIAYVRSENLRKYIIPVIVSLLTTIATHSLLWLLQQI